MMLSNYTLEAVVRARMEDRMSEAEQYRRVRLARQGSTSGQQDQAIWVSPFGWLRQLATRIAGAGA